jgi:hypothetical protein
LAAGTFVADRGEGQRRTEGQCASGTQRPFSSRAPTCCPQRSHGWRCHCARPTLATSNLFVSSLKKPSHGFTGIGIRNSASMIRGSATAERSAIVRKSQGVEETENWGPARAYSIPPCLRVARQTRRPRARSALRVARQTPPPAAARAPARRHPERSVFQRSRKPALSEAERGPASAFRFSARLKRMGAPFLRLFPGEGWDSTNPAALAATKRSAGLQSGCRAGVHSRTSGCARACASRAEPRQLRSLRSSPTRHSINPSEAGSGVRRPNHWLS